jgi:putative DNA primase/helicase
VSAERDAAVAYAARGWPVFPLHPIEDGRCGCRDPKCKAVGKHPITRGWPNAVASVSAAEGSWGPKFGPRGIGLVCGPRSGVFGLDADRRHGAEATLANWKHQGRRLETVIDETGDGWHALLRWPDGFEPEIRAQDLGGGVSCRGAGHFLVLAPTVHWSGQRYRWIRSPDDHEVAPAPDWLLELIAASSKRKRLIESTGDGEQLRVPVGHRHHALVRWLGRERSMGFGEAALIALTDVFLDHAVEIDEARCPLDREHAHDQARDIAKRYKPTRTNPEDRQ